MIAFTFQIGVKTMAVLRIEQKAKNLANSNQAEENLRLALANVTLRSDLVVENDDKLFVKLKKKSFRFFSFLFKAQQIKKLYMF